MTLFTNKIENNLFSKIASTRVGGTIYLQDASIVLSMKMCSFYKCTTTGTGASTSRSGSIAAGACFFDISELIIESISFEECNGDGVGSSMYICTPQNKRSNATCITTNKWG